MNFRLLPLLLALAAPALAQMPAKIKVKTKGEPAPAALPAPAAPDLPAAYAGRYLTQEALRRDLTVLASDEYEGRETGTKGQKMAAIYIARQFALDSLVAPVPGSAGSPYWQSFGLERSAWQPGGTLVVGGTTYQWLKDFYATGRLPFVPGTVGQPVFVGYGIEQGAYSDYAGRDVQGKDLLMLAGEPRTPAGKSVLGPNGSPSKWAVDYRAKATLAAQKGARSIILINTDAINTDAPAAFAKTAARLGPRLTLPTLTFADLPGHRAPTFFVAPALGLKLLGTTEAKLHAYEAATAAAGAPVPTRFRPGSVVFKVVQQRETVSTENVLGFLPGTDKKDEVLVLSAHYDHLGIIGGQVYNGADDDGSGTVALLALARAFTRAAEAGHGPRRSILFLANTGEEKGLLGSEYYTTHPLYPLAATVADLNMDMLGRTDPAHAGKPDYVYVIGSDKLSSQLHAAVLAANEQQTRLDLDFRFNDPADPNRFYYRSDHYNFAVHKIPVAFFFNGVHADYHQASDEVGRIEFDKLEARARLVFFVAWDVANREARLVVDSDKP